MVIAIDFDGTIHDPTARTGSYRMGPPKPGTILALNKLAEQGHTIVVFTARNVQKPEAYKAVEDWLIYFKIPYHGITNIKQPAFDVMIDDRGLHFENWSETMSDLAKYENAMAVKNYRISPPQLIDDITKPL